MGGGDDRLEARSAQPIYRLAGHLDRQAGQQCGQAAHVAVVLARLVRGAQDDVVDARRVDAGSLDEGANDMRRQVIGPDILQGAAVSAERGAQAVNDNGSAGGIAVHRPDATRAR